MKRIAIKLVVFLLLSAVVNVAVAWGCTVWISARALSVDVGQSQLDERSSFWTIQYVRRRGLAHVYSSQTDFGLANRWTQTAEEALPHWSKLEAPSSSAAERETASGWPMYALSWTLSEWIISESSGRRGRTFAAGLQIGPASILPLRPLWLGFTVNTLFYAAILWTLFVAPFATRRLIRKRRGKCVRCGYDLTGMEHEVCPECGGRQ